jgi:hypothetical protein
MSFRKLVVSEKNNKLKIQDAHCTLAQIEETGFEVTSVFPKRKVESGEQLKRTQCYH